MHALVAEAYRNLGELLKAKNHYIRAIEKDKASPGAALRAAGGALGTAGVRPSCSPRPRGSSSRTARDGPGRYFHSLALSRTGAADRAGPCRAPAADQGTRPGSHAHGGAGRGVRAGRPSRACGRLVPARHEGRPEPTAESLMALAEVYEALGKKEQRERPSTRTSVSFRRTATMRRRLLHMLLDRKPLPTPPSISPSCCRWSAATRMLKVDACRLLPAHGSLRRGAGIPEGPSDRDARRRKSSSKAAVYCLDRMGARSVGMRALESFMKQHGESSPCSSCSGVLQLPGRLPREVGRNLPKGRFALAEGLESQSQPGHGLSENGKRHLCREIPRKISRIPPRGGRSAEDQAQAGGARRPAGHERRGRRGARLRCES